MSVQDDVKAKAENWFFGQELPSLMKTGAAFAAGHLTSDKMIPILSHWGITIDPQKFSSSLETWGMGLVVAFAAHYAVKWGHENLIPPTRPPEPPAPPAS